MCVKDPLQALGDAEIHIVLSLLSPLDMVCAGAVCRSWKMLVDSESHSALRWHRRDAWLARKDGYATVDEAAREFKRLGTVARGRVDSRATIGANGSGLIR